MEMKRGKIASSHCELRRKVIYFSISSRLFIIFISFISNFIIPDHDAGVFKYPQQEFNKSSLDYVIETLFGGLSRWDAQYFLHISHYGYTYENTLAFFPLFPLFVRILAHGLDYTLGSMLNPLSTVLISAVLINMFFFVNTATRLFDLSCKILQDDKVSYSSALFFCLNPASIFFTAPYSESCFAFFTFSGMLLYLECDKGLLSSFVAGLSGSVRSNGIISYGFLVHKSLKIPLHCMSASRKLFPLIHFIHLKIFMVFIYTVVFFMPFGLFQFYTYSKYCLADMDDSIPSFLRQFGESNQFVMPGSNSSPWCNYSIPFSYSYVQSHYWNVGFLKYYESKQIPNFLLASPVIILVLTNIYYFMAENKVLMFSLGFNETGFAKYGGRNLRPEFFVFVVHALFLAVFCTLFIHIQVITRMLASSSPLIYWFVALRYRTESTFTGSTVSSRLNNQNKFSLVETKHNMNSFWKTFILTDRPADWWSSLVRLYFCVYMVVGTILFSNFYPWT